MTLQEQVRWLRSFRRKLMAGKSINPESDTIAVLMEAADNLEKLRLFLDSMCESSGNILPTDKSHLT